MNDKRENVQNTKWNIDGSCEDWIRKPFANPNCLIRLGSTFSGIGAIEHALFRLGLNYRTMFAGDVDDNCKKAYFANYDMDENRWHRDIRDFDARQFKGQIDLLVGGAPCQAFSMRGKRGGFEDTRGTLFNEFARVVRECQPKVFIFENVKGMLSHDKGKTWATIKNTFEDYCGYDVHYQVLNGKDYGIPQSRERLFCIGFKKARSFKYPVPIPLEKCLFDFLQETVDGRYFLRRKGVNFVTRTINHIKSYTQVNGAVMLCQKRNQQFNWHGDFIYHPALKEEPISDGKDEFLFRVCDFEESYYLDKTSSRYALIPMKKNIWLMDKNGDRQIDKSKGRFRKFTPRECLRLMGFDDSFQIVVTDTECYKQAGNSIIVDVLMAILRQLDITCYGIQVRGEDRYG